MTKENICNNKVIVNSNYLNYLTHKLYYPKDENIKSRIILAFVCKSPKGNDNPLMVFSLGNLLGIGGYWGHRLEDINKTTLNNRSSQYFRKGNKLYVKTAEGSIYTPYIFLAQLEYTYKDVLRHIEKIQSVKISKEGISRWDNILSNDIELEKYIPLSGRSYVRIEYNTEGINTTQTFSYQVVVKDTNIEYSWYSEPTAYLKINYPEICDLTEKYGKYHLCQISKKTFGSLISDLKKLEGKYIICERKEDMENVKMYKTDEGLTKIKRAYGKNTVNILEQTKVGIEELYKGNEVVKEFVQKRGEDVTRYEIYLSQISIDRQVKAFKEYCKNFANGVYKVTNVEIDPKILETSHAIYDKYKNYSVRYRS